MFSYYISAGSFSSVSNPRYTSHVTRLFQLKYQILLIKIVPQIRDIRGL